MRMAALGEVMLEMSPVDSRDHFRLGVAGDTYNTAVMLARQGFATRYITRLGKDRFSDRIVDAALKERIDTCAIQRVPSELPGLYLIHNHAQGEREFFYWRDHSPARSLFVDRDSTAVFQEAVAECDWLYLSGITAAVMGQPAECHFLGAIEQARKNGVCIAYDPNFRPALWASLEDARRWNRRILALCDLVLPTLADERALWGDECAESVVARCREAGAGEVAVKCQDALAQAWRAGHRAELVSDYRGPVVDTTGAGDAFNAGYLAARVQGEDLLGCLARAHKVAAEVLAVKGALP